MLIILLTNKWTEYKVCKTSLEPFSCVLTAHKKHEHPFLHCALTRYVVLNTYLILIICWEIPKQEKKTFWLQRCLLKNDGLKQVIIKHVIVSCPKTQPLLLSHEERFLSTSVISVKSVSKPDAGACPHTREAEAKEGWVQGQCGHHRETPQVKQENQIFPYIILAASPICIPKDFLSYFLRKRFEFLLCFKMCILRAYFERTDPYFQLSWICGSAQGCQRHDFNQKHAQWRAVSTPECRWGMNSDTHCLSRQRQKEIKENKEIQRFC